MNARTRAYLELIRPPNVTTAFADVLAGFAVAGRSEPRALPWLLVSTSCLYAGGVVLNDVFDRNLDAVERPERPIPSGRISSLRAATFGVGLLAAGVVAAVAVSPLAAAIAVGIVTMAVLYDARGKHSRVLGPWNMGACRGLNLALGMTTAPALMATHWPIALISVIYIAGVTTLSRGEVHGGTTRTGAAATALLSMALAALVIIAIRPGAFSLMALLLTALLAWRVAPAFWRAWRAGSPTAIRTAVRAGVLSLVLLDAAIGSAYAGMIYGLLMLTIALAAGRLARLFAVT